MACGSGAFGGFLFGFDTAVISGTVGPLQRQFELGRALLGWTVNSALLGSVVEAGSAGWLGDRLGRQVSLMAAGAGFLVSAIGSAATPSLAFLMTARLVGGIGVGLAGTTAPVYISEVSPAVIRGRMVTQDNFLVGAQAGTVLQCGFAGSQYQLVLATKPHFRMISGMELS